MKQREIKYRAWNGSKMIYDFHLNKDWIYAMKRSTEGYGGFELMQYIGKEDINKKEIYERDIIIGKIIVGYGKDEDNENGVSPSPAQIYGEIKGEIFWDEYKLSYLIREKNANRNLDVFSKYLYEVEKIEVIGNTFKNKELLK